MKKYLLIFIILLVVLGGGYFEYLYTKKIGGPGGETSRESKNESEIQKTGQEKNKQSLIERNLNPDELKCPDCNLVIVSLTNTRKDHIGLYGYKRDTTPNIDTFFKNSLIFENVFAPASWTLPVAVSLYTSLFPYSPGVMDRYDGSRLDDDVLTFTEIFKANDYKTAAFTGGGDYNRKFNFAQGFDAYVDEENYSDFGIDYRGGANGQAGPAAYLGIEQLVSPASDWFIKNDGNKKFLLLQGFDTHCPFTPSGQFKEKFTGEYKGDIDFSVCLWTFKQTEPIYENGKKYWTLQTWYSPDKGIQEIKVTDEDVAYMIDLYDGEIAQADSYLKDFFDAIKNSELEKNTIFIFMSEHGDLFGEHGRFMRGGPLRGTFYDPVVNPPLIMKHPKIKEPVTIRGLVQTVDVMPTLLDMLGLADPQAETRQGKSIISELAGGPAVNEFIYAGSRYAAKNNLFFDGLSVVESIRNKEWKLIKEEIFDSSGQTKKEESYELYNISADPKEEKNFIEDEKEIAGDLKDKLNQWAASLMK